jgi:hypothetical protein
MEKGEDRPMVTKRSIKSDNLAYMLEQKILNAFNKKREEEKRVLISRLELAYA